jgi:hypothetical protein
MNITTFKNRIKEERNIRMPTPYALTLENFELLNFNNQNE